MNKKNGREDGLSNGQKLMFYPVNEVACGIVIWIIFLTLPYFNN